MDSKTGQSDQSERTEIELVFEYNNKNSLTNKKIENCTSSSLRFTYSKVLDKSVEVGNGKTGDKGDSEEANLSDGSKSLIRRLLSHARKIIASVVMGATVVASIPNTQDDEPVVCISGYSDTPERKGDSENDMSEKGCLNNSSDTEITVFDTDKIIIKYPNANLVISVVGGEDNDNTSVVNAVKECIDFLESLISFIEQIDPKEAQRSK